MIATFCLLKEVASFPTFSTSESVLYEVPPPTIRHDLPSALRQTTYADVTYLSSDLLFFLVFALVRSVT